MRPVLAAALLTLACAGLPPDRVDVGAGAGASEYREPYTGETFVDLCDDHTQAARCGAYVEGARSGMRALRLLIAFQLDKAKLAPPPQMAPLLQQEPFCVPPAASTDELVGVVVSFIRANPDRHKDSAAFAIVLALENAYPCKA